MILTSACIAWTGATAVVAMWATIRSRRRPSQERSPVAGLLLRPCAGDEPWLADALLTSTEARACRVRFLVATPGDGASSVAGGVERTLLERGHDVRLVVTCARGPNRKADQLARAMSGEEQGSDDIVIVADSDVALSREAITDLVAPLLDGDADASWAPPLESGAQTTADRASQAILDASLHSFPLLAALDPKGMVGKLFAIRTGALERAGGFGALVEHLGEDMELARRLSALGLRVRVTATPAASLARGRTWRAVVERYRRWVSVIRAQRPALLVSYPLLLCAAPLQLTLGCVAAAQEGGAGWGAVAAAVAVRGGIAAIARIRCGRTLAGLGLAPWLGDVTLLIAVAAAIGSRTLSWRGVPLRVGAGGVLLEGKR